MLVQQEVTYCRIFEDRECPKSAADFLPGPRFFCAYAVAAGVRARARIASRTSACLSFARQLEDDQSENQDNDNGGGSSSLQAQRAKLGVSSQLSAAT